MKRERYKGQIVVARLLKVRALPIWHASVCLDRLVNGTWLEIPIEPGLAGLEFASEDIALSAATRERSLKGSQPGSIHLSLCQAGRAAACKRIYRDSPSRFSGNRYRQRLAQIEPK
jgi:hypothetical protein